jgi:predicted extracellular nuclease
MKKLIIIFSFVIPAYFFLHTNAGTYNSSSITGKDSICNNRYLRVMFYNVENLFDTRHDSLKNDEEFLAEGSRHWTADKMYKKINNIARVITAVGGWEPPDLVGLSEIENRYVLNALVRNSPLKVQNYQIIHRESPDIRGIDVALLYQRNKFRPVTIDFIPVIYEGNSHSTTREILMVKGLTNRKDTLFVFVNHWPSRWEGQLESEERRMFVASIVRNKVDSIFTCQPGANIIIMGDLNDYPDNKSLVDILKAKTEYDTIQENELYNLSYYLQFKKGLGTLKYDGHWGILDQMVVSGRLLVKNQQLFTSIEDAHVYNADFLLEKDEAQLGFKPFRTFIGFQYHGGFSDHLPVYLDLYRNVKE